MCYNDLNHQELFTHQQNITCHKTWIPCRTATNILHIVITKWENLVLFMLTTLKFITTISFISKISVTALSGVAVITVLNWWLPHNHDKPLQFKSDCPVVSCQCDLNHCHKWHTEQQWKLRHLFPPPAFFWCVLTFWICWCHFCYSTLCEPHTYNSKFLFRCPWALQLYHIEILMKPGHHMTPASQGYYRTYTCILMCFCCH